MIDHSPEEVAALKDVDRCDRRCRHWLALWAAVMWSGQTLPPMIFVSWSNLGHIGMGAFGYVITLVSLRLMFHQLRKDEAFDRRWVQSTVRRDSQMRLWREGRRRWAVRRQLWPRDGAPEASRL